MSRKRVALAVVCFCTMLQAQIAINTADMPQSSTNYRSSISAARPDIDFAATGANHQWNFTSLAPASQIVDSFKTIASAPQIMQLFFLNPLDSLKPNLMLKMRASDLPVALDAMAEVGDFTAYRFFDSKNTRFALVAYGVETDSLSGPLKFSAADVLYSLPMSFGNSDSSVSGTAFPPAGLNIDIGFSFSMTQKRVNRVDGWGTLKTPFGTFPALRQVSQLKQTVTLTTDTGTQVIDVPLQTEYTWLAQGKGVPVLRVLMVGEGLVAAAVSIMYQDSAREISAARPFANKFAIQNGIAQRGGFLDFSNAGNIDFYNLTGRVVSRYAPQGRGSLAVRSGSILGVSGTYLMHSAQGAAGKISVVSQ